MNIPPPEEQKFIVEYTRMEFALQQIRSYANSAVIGGWRHHVASMANNGLQKVVLPPPPPSRNP